MASNTITVVGNLTRDPELRYTQSGKATVTVGIAVNRRYQVNGEWQDQKLTKDLVRQIEDLVNFSNSISEKSGFTRR